MDRTTWLASRQAATRADYDVEASGYDSDGYPDEAQRRFVDRLLETCPPGGLVLDAPCGTGKYFGQVTAAGHRVVGIDQSSGMLAEARAKGIATSLEQVSLQELDARHAFDAVMTVDAMENVSPEDWPRVLENLARAARPGACLYLTVEERTDEAAIDDALASLVAAGAPAVRGEVVEGDVAGYHYYPARDAVLRWFGAAGLDVLTEEYVQADAAWGYRHFLLRAARA